jgi:hypothetical protein
MRLGFNVAIVLLAGATTAQAQEWPRVDIFVGAQLADFGTDVRLNASTSVLGSTIDFERELGFNENAGVVWAGGVWRISRRNQIDVGWIRVDRDVSRRQLQRDIRFGQETFDVSAEVDAFLDTWFVGGSYRFALVATPVVEAGPLIGLLAINLSTGIGLSGAVGGASRSTNIRKSSFTAPAVLPGAFINIRAHPRLTIRARGGYISADFGDVDGEVVQAQAGADFMFTRSIGLGGNYSFNKLSVGLEEDDFRGDVRYSFNGPQIYGVLSF